MRTMRQPTHDESEATDVSMTPSSEEESAGPRPATAQDTALQLARDRVAQRLGAGRTPLPPDLGGGLFALAALSDSAIESTPPNGATPPGALKTFVASFGITPEHRANLSFLPPEISAWAEALTGKLNALFLRHAGSNDRSHDGGGVPIDGGNYPNLVALRMKWRELAQTALRMGELYRIRAEAAPTQRSNELMHETRARWDRQVRLFETAVDNYQEDDPARIAAARQRWRTIQSLGLQLRKAAAPSETPALTEQVPMAPPGTTEERQLALAQRRLASLDQEAHDAAVAELLDRHPELHTHSGEVFAEELVKEYVSTVAAQRWRQPERARHEQLVTDLQAPMAELEARRCSRRAAEVRAFAEGLRYPKGKLSPRRQREWLEGALGQRGFGSRAGQSLPKLDRWIQQHFRGLSVLALRKGRTYLRERVASLGKLPPLTLFNLRDLQQHLTAVVRAYEEANQSLLESTRHQEEAVRRVRHTAHPEETSGAPTLLLGHGYNFQSSFPQSLRGTREDNPDPRIPEATWICAMHGAWTDDLQHAQRKIQSSSGAIANPVNPKTGRKLKKLDPHSERHYRHELDSAKRTIERILVDYRGRFGVEAARRFSDHLEWLEVTAVRDLPMNALPAEEETRRALVFEWAGRYVQMWLYDPDLSQERSPGSKTQCAAASTRDAGLDNLCQEARANQAVAESNYRKAYGPQALELVLQEVRRGLAVRGCKVMPAPPGNAGAIDSTSRVGADAPTEHAPPPLSSPTSTPPAGESAEAADAATATEVGSQVSRTGDSACESSVASDTFAADRPDRSASQSAKARASSSVATSVADSTQRDAATNDSASAEVTWNRAIPDTSGISQYTLLIRAPGDERFEKRRRGRKVGGQLAWRDALSPSTLEVWLRKMRQILADGTARTFNRIILEASEGQFTADVAGGKAPEHALWEMLHRGEMEWANHPGGYVIWRNAAIAAPGEAKAVVVQQACQASPVPTVSGPEETAVQESLTTVRHIFASGMTRPVDMAGAIEAAHAFGVDVGSLSPSGRAGVIRAVRANVPVFVDSGAFRLFRENLGLTAAQAGQLAFLSGCGRGLNDDQVMKRYAGLVIDLGRSRSVELEHLYLVAPDVVGNATETLRLLRKHRSLLTEFLDVGVNVIVPVQRDQQYGFVEMAESAAQILASANASHILGIPTQECAMQETDLQVLLSRQRPARIHLLGSAVAQTAGHRLRTVRQHNDETDVTMDGNLLRSRLDEIAGLSGEARSSAIASLLVRATAGKQEVTAQAFMDASASHVRLAATQSDPKCPSPVSGERLAIDAGRERAQPEPGPSQVPQMSAARRPRSVRTSRQSGG